jgi:hypothetical protein
MVNSIYKICKFYKEDNVVEGPGSYTIALCRLNKMKKGSCISCLLYGKQHGISIDTMRSKFVNQNVL